MQSDDIFYAYGYKIELVGYIHNDWASDVEEWKSTLGYAFNLVFGVFSWLSKKQHVIALSTVEVEYIETNQTIEVCITRMLSNLKHT